MFTCFKTEYIAQPHQLNSIDIHYHHDPSKKALQKRFFVSAYDAALIPVLINFLM